MSFDLYFYKKKNSIVTEKMVAEYLNVNLNFNTSNSTRQWCYENPETGVYFSFDWNEPETDPESIALFDNFSDFINLNFTCNINFFRADFFASEVFPTIDKIVYDLDLFILNPQDEIDAENPQKFPDSYLKEQWIMQNSDLTKRYFKEMNFNFLSLEKSNYLWSFQYIREDLQNSLEEDIYVSSIMVLKNKDNNKLYTVCVWPQHIPVILPKVDYVIIKRQYKKFFRSVEESGLVAYDVILNELGNDVQDFKHNIPFLKVLTPAAAPKVKNKFNSLPIYKEAKEFGTLVKFDGFVNYEDN